MAKFFNPITFQDGTTMGTATATPIGITWSMLPMGEIATPQWVVAPSNIPSTNQPYGPALIARGLISATPGIAFPDGTTLSSANVTGTLPANAALIDISDLITGLWTYATPATTSYTAGPWIRGGLISATPGIQFPDKTTLVSAQLSHVINVKQLGATGDGATLDDAAFIQAASICRLNSQGGIIFAPIGTYLLSTPVQMPSNTTLVGEGMGSILKKNSAFDLVTFNGPATLNHIVKSGIEDLRLDGNNQRGALIQGTYASNLNFNHVFGTSNLGPGVDFAEVWDSRVYHVAMASVGEAATPAFSILNSREKNGTYGYSTDNCNQITFYGCIAETWKGGGYYVATGKMNTTNPNGIHFIHCKAESINARGPGFSVNNSVRFSSIRDCYVSINGIEPGNGPVSGIFFQGAQGCTIDDCLIVTGATPMTLVTEGLYVWGNDPLEIGNIIGIYSQSPSVAHFNAFSGGNYTITGPIQSTGATTNIANQDVSKRFMPPAGMMLTDAKPLTTDFGGFNFVPPIGYPVWDKTNSKLYIKSAQTNTWNDLWQATPILAMSPNAGQGANGPAGPAIQTQGPILATPGIVFQDGSSLTTTGIKGLIDSAGVSKQGTGFTVTATTATQKYVNFAAAPLYATPLIIVTPWSPGVGVLGDISVANPGRNGFFALTANSAGTATPFGFSFQAII